ncbi:MAG TPA: Do family serine endopeptidase [Abditibacteriaceae bacterium]|jgi:serine protease Do|nr:Do family serine endopeptidase [Abditibacteriaceae bacterium]
MNEMSFRKRNGAAMAGVATVALAGGYMAAQQVARAQTGAVPTTTTPVVQTPATRDARAIQNAFAQVSDAVGPAVVTITTSRAAGAASSRTPRRSPFGGSPFGRPQPGAPNAPGGAPNAPGPNGNDPFEEFFKQFNQKFGFQPNALQRDEIRSHFQPVQERGGGLGSGMIFRSDGYIITNAHVVKGADPANITVKMNDDREFRHAQLVGSDEGTDIAVLKINANNLPVVKLGDSGDVNVGDWAIAIGNPFSLDHTVTVGIISAKAREVQLSDRGGAYLQTDASINPGNSGGPLCDINGRVVGVNNAIYSESGGNMGIGFAIPINTAREIAEQLVKNGKITRGYLGVLIQNLDARNAASYGLDENIKGVLVAKVNDNTPGARAGLQEGDVITTINGKGVSKSNELQALVGAAPVGSTAQLRVLRNGQTISLNARLDELKPESGSSAVTPNNSSPQVAPSSTALGLRIAPLTPTLKQQLGLTATRGLVVLGVTDGSPAEQAGIQRGDVVERVGQKPVTTVADFTASVNAILRRQTEDSKSVALLVNRKGDKTFVTVSPGQ